jgi:hypothetical protein
VIFFFLIFSLYASKRKKIDYREASRNGLLWLMKQNKH